MGQGFEQSKSPKPGVPVGLIGLLGHPKAIAGRVVSSNLTPATTFLNFRIQLLSMLTDADGAILLKSARTAIDAHLNKKKFKPLKDLAQFSAPAGVFVTLHKGEELCGCIGLPWPTKPLSEGLTDAAVQACEDSRFTPLIPDELSGVSIEVSVLSTPEEMNVTGPDELLKQLQPHKDGLIMRKGNRGALFLPQVWEQILDKEEFLCHLCNKAGLPTDAWMKGCQFWRFHVQIFNEQVHA